LRPQRYCCTAAVEVAQMELRVRPALRVRKALQVQQAQEAQV
jgi:hypothetical protein